MTNVRKCGGLATLSYYNSVTGVRTFIESKTYYANSASQHVDVFFNIPNCAAQDRLVISFINLKDGSTSAEATRYISTNAMEVGLASPMPFLQFKCNDDLWDPIIPKGGKVSVNSGVAPIVNYGGLVYYFNQNQNHKTDQPISQTDNGLGFSPYSLTYMPFSQQQQGGQFKYSIPAGACDPRGTNFNTMGFFRLNVNSALKDVDDVDGKIIDPDGLFCVDNIKCNLPKITYFPLIGPTEVNIANGGKITDVKYYYVNSAGNRIENARMSTAGGSLVNGVVLYRKKVCFADLKNSNGTPEVCNYIIRYKVEVVSGYTPEGGLTYTSCYVEYPTTVTPVTDGNQVSGRDKLALLLETYNRIRNQLIDLPNFTEKMVCDIMFSVVAILSKEFVLEEVVDITELNEQSLKHNVDIIKNALTRELVGLEFFWKDNLNNVYYDIEEIISKKGEYKLYSKDLNGVIWKVYNLIIQEKEIDTIFKVSDLISEQDFENFINALDPNVNYPDFYTSERTKLVTNGTYSDFDQDYFDYENINIVKSLQTIVFPNPIDNFVNIRTEGINTKVKGAIIQDLFGRTIASYSFLIELNEVKIELDNIVSGTYILKVLLSDNNIETHKFIKP